jgi:hypothetical protein
MRYKVYLAKLKRLFGSPKTVYKIGITSSSDAMERLTYTGADEPYPIVEAFPDIKIMKAIWCSSKEEALLVEQHIMNAIKGDEKYFHNWYEKNPLSGITEMRKWNYDELLKCIQLMDEALICNFR